MRAAQLFLNNNRPRADILARQTGSITMSDAETRFRDSGRKLLAVKKGAKRAVVYERHYRDGRAADMGLGGADKMELISAALRTEREGKGRLALRLLAIAAACVIAAGLAAAALGLLLRGYKDFSVVKGGGPPASDKTADGFYSGLGASKNKGAALALKGELSATEIYDLVCKACVGVTTPVATTNAFGQTTAAAITGSGFIISPDGYILTNYHVVQTADESGLEILVMLYGGEEYKADIVGRDSENDIALLKIDAGNLAAVALGDFSGVKIGETVYAIGNPLGELTYSMTSGIVSALDRTITVEANMPINMFQIDAAINSGNSGGPVLNSRGEVIGIASAKYSSAGVEGLGFAIPINDAVAIADSLLKYGYVKGRPLFGITVYTVLKDYDGPVDGACIASVDPEGCAAKAGLQAGDIVTAVDGSAIASSSDLIAAKKKHKAGDTVVLTVYRNGEYLELSVTLDEAGAPPSASAREEESFRSHSDYGSGGGR